MPWATNCHSNWLGFSSIDWPGTKDVVVDALEAASAILGDELETCSVNLMDDSFVDDSKSEMPFTAEPVVVKSDLTLADDKFVTNTIKVAVVTAETSETFVFTAVVFVAELVVTSRPKVVEFNVLVLRAFSPVVEDSSFVERSTAPLELAVNVVAVAEAVSVAV